MNEEGHNPWKNKSKYFLIDETLQIFFKIRVLGRHQLVDDTAEAFYKLFELKCQKIIEIGETELPHKIISGAIVEECQ